MQTSEPGGVARGVLPALLIAANLLLFAGWPWLRSLPLGADSTDVPWKVLGEGPSARRSLRSESILRNSQYLASFVESVRREERVLFLGTSETLPGYNLGAQLNAVSPEDPPMVVLAKMGTSPIHSALLFAICQREGIATPPLVLLLNPVYFTQSHDGINDGWMSFIMRSQVFAQLDHRRILRELDDATRARYAEHFRLKRFLLPFFAQTYLGNLLYLHFHQNGRPAFESAALPIHRYEFDGTVPEYDPVQAVHSGYSASDRFAKGRWAVKSVKDCLNLTGLVGAAGILKNQSAPVLLLVLPINRTFYASNGLDMKRVDREYGEIRDAIDRLEKPGHTFVVDLYDSPWLDRGFRDRMHMDEYGFHQIAEHLASDPTYRKFIETVRGYYGKSPG